MISIEWVDGGERAMELPDLSTKIWFVFAKNL
jgi:hypothetical protein